jgi:hypothetical protein
MRSSLIASEQPQGSRDRSFVDLGIGDVYYARVENAAGLRGAPTTTPIFAGDVSRATHLLGVLEAITCVVLGFDVLILFLTRS